MKSKQKKNSTQKMTKKFLGLPYGRIFRIRVVNIMVLLMVCTGIYIYIQQNKIAENTMKTSQSFQLFLRIDDLAHQQFAEMEARGNPSGFAGFEKFEEIDTAFHAAQTMQEKFIQAKKMDVFFHKMDTYLHQVGGLTSTGDLSRDREYHAIDSIFDALQKNF